MATLHVRIDEKTKAKVQKILEDMGLDMSTAVNIYFHHIAMQEAIPFQIVREMRVPDHIMEEWEREAQDALSNGKGYSSVEELHADILGKDYLKKKNLKK